MTFDNGQEPPKRHTSVWAKVLGFGCGGVLLLLIVCAALIAGNWSKFSGYYQNAKSTFSDMMAVQAALQKKYQAEVRLTAKRESGVQGSILGVALIDAPLMDRISVDGPAGRQAALEVATAARDALPPGGRYDNYEVGFVRQRGGAVNISGSWTFRFTAADLPPAKAETDGPGRK
jgi:hypothetical protein